jgi:YesN/AraC family two-component response regulator
MPAKRIKFNELTLVLKGSLEYEVDGQTFFVDAGDCIFIKENSLRKRNLSQISDYVSFNFHGKICGELPTLIKDCINSDVTHLIAVCDNVFAKYTEWYNVIDGALITLINLLQARVANREEHPVIVHIKRFVRTNFSQKISLKDIADNVGYSPNYCDTFFKERTGESLIYYVINRRIDEAKLLLIEGALSLKDAAFAVGFEDYNYFCRLFKKKTNYTPSEYKNK